MSDATVPVDRITAALADLAPRVNEQDVRAQLYALIGVLRNSGAPPADGTMAATLEQAVDAAIAAGDEAAAVDAMRNLAALKRSVVIPVDWSRASGG